MKIEEAIKILHPDTTFETITEIEYYGGFKGKEKAMEALNEACVLACGALEKQIPKKLKHGICPSCSTNNNRIIKHLGNPQVLFLKCHRIAR